MMKKKVLCLLLAVLMLCAMLPRQANAAGESDLTFTLNSDGESYSLVDCETSAQGELQIPATYQGKPVTGIGDSAFLNCSGLTSVSIPDGVTKISEFAFAGCNKMASVTIPGSVTDIEERAFYCCNKLADVYITDPSAWCKISFAWYSNPLNYEGQLHVLDGEGNEITGIVLDASVTAIPYRAFSRCRNVTAITIPDSVTRIGERAFYYCSSMTEVYYGGTEAQWAQISVDKDNGQLTNATIHYNASIFNDVNKTSWQYVHVKYALDRNLMAGKGTDALGRIKFDPNSPITREEFVQVLYNAEDKPAVSLANPFPDVKDNGWYKNAVLWAKKNDIANGGGDGRFGVGAKITRQDLALMLYKYATIEDCSLDATAGRINRFADGDKVATYAKTAMDWAVTNGILSGKGVAGQPLSTFKLDPAGTATRAECAAMLRNFMEAFGL